MAISSTDLDIENMFNNGKINEKLLKIMKNRIGCEGIQAQVEIGSKIGISISICVYRLR